MSQKKQFFSGNWSLMNQEKQFQCEEGILALSYVIYLKCVLDFY